MGDSVSFALENILARVRAYARGSKSRTWEMIQDVARTLLSASV